jgi:exopolysaccharide biosynthesis polyprenyl glycosylphosphotransferase
MATPSKSVVGSEAASCQVVSRASRRRTLSQKAAESALLRVSDMLAALMALAIAVEIRIHPILNIHQLVQAPPYRRTLVLIEATCIVLFALVFHHLDRGESHYACHSSIWSELRNVVGACLIAALLVSGGLYLLEIGIIRPATIISLASLTCVTVCVNRIGWRLLRTRRHNQGIDCRHVLIVGTNRASQALRRQIQNSPRTNRKFTGFLTIDKRPFGEDFEPSFTLGGMSQLREVCRFNFIDEIILAEDCPAPAIIELVRDAREMGIDVFTLPGIHHDSSDDLPSERIGDFPLIALHLEEACALGRLAKRMCDLAFSLFGLILVSPALLIIAIAIRLDSDGPVLYISERVGRKGRTFRCLKFRTMCVNADRMKAQLISFNERDRVLFKMTNDPRVTRVGRLLRKYSLDELPQIVNVIRGEMSLVGPRPSIASEVKLYQVEHYRRLVVTPGLTGLWQVTARSDPSFEKYVEADLDYVKNWSFWLDLSILMKTAFVVLRGNGC